MRRYEAPRGRAAHVVRGLALAAVVLLAGPGAARAATLPEGFTDTVALGGLLEPINIEFASDGRVFVAEKSGVIKVFDDLSDPTPTVFANFRTNVYSMWDRGLLGMALAPDFPADPYVYVLYTHDAAIGGTAPRWGQPGGTFDGCPTPPGPSGDGCVVSGRLSRFEADGDVAAGPEQVLIEDWCQQYSSHSIGDLAFGPDGALYASAGDGASFNFVDYGQDGDPVNPCGDPPGGVGGAMTPPTAEGGALRSQDLLTPADPPDPAPPPPPPPPPPPVESTHILRPDGDVTSAWSLGGGAATGWQALDDDVIQPASVPVEQFAYDKVAGEVLETTLANRDISGQNPTAGKAWFYGNVAAGAQIRADVVWGGQVRQSTTISGGTNGLSYGWRSIDVTPPDQAAVNDLRLRFTITTGAQYGSNLFASYFELTTFGQSGGGGTTGAAAAAAQPAAATGGSSLLRPDGDITSQWRLGGSSTAWEALDDEVTEPTAVPAEQFVYEKTPGKVLEVSLGRRDVTGERAVIGKAWFYGNLASGAELKVDVLWGGQVRATKTLTGSLSYGWRSIDALPPDQAAVDDLRLRFTINGNAQFGSNLFAAYFQLETVPAVVTDPTGLSGTVIRVDPATGEGLPGNPLAASDDPNERRIIATGLRNPFRFAVRPGTSELWLGEVGWGTWEEIDRINAPTDAAADNFGWPCYEGQGRQGGYDAANLGLCEDLYATPGAVSSPYLVYNHSSKVVSGESCPTGSSSLAGADFYTGDEYPAGFAGAFVFADYSRDCIWAMKTTGGVPDPGKIVTLVAGASNPVELEPGPAGDIFYADIENGTIHRIRFAGNRPPVATATANPTSGPLPLNVQFDGSGSSDPNQGDPLSYAWDLDGDGQYDDSIAVSPQRTYTQAATIAVGLRVTDSGGLSATDQVTITPGNSPPEPQITTPTTATSWSVGEAIDFSGGATDPEDGPLGADRLTWKLTLQHCPSNCHSHPFQTYERVKSGSFNAPDHEYPSHLELTLTATDSLGLSASKTVALQPRTVALRLESSPTGLTLALNANSGPAPLTGTVIEGSSNSVSAPSPQQLGGQSYDFLSWSDGGAATHQLVADSSGTYTASFGQSQAAARSAAPAIPACSPKRKGRGKRSKGNRGKKGAQRKGKAGKKRGKGNRGKRGKRKGGGRRCAR